MTEMATSWERTMRASMTAIAMPGLLLVLVACAGSSRKMEAPPSSVRPSPGEASVQPSPSEASLASPAPLGTVTPPREERPLEVPPLGTFASTGGLLGEWTMTAGYCQSLVSEKDGQTTIGVLFTKDVDRLFVAKFAPGRQPAIAIKMINPSRELDVRRDQCARFDAQARLLPDGAIDVDIDLECNVREGARVTASLHASHCR
jgi:hypothetical protein